MSLALPVHHPHILTRVLLRSGVELSSRAIDRLQEQGVQEIWIAWPGLEFLREKASPKLDQSQRELTRKLGDIFDKVAEEQRPDAEYSELKGSITNFLDKIYESPNAALFLSELIGSHRPMLRHASSVCLLSLLMGLRLGGYLIKQRTKLRPRDAENIVNLGVGAILHDIGLTNIDSDVIKRHHETGDDTDPEWRQHVLDGYRMVHGKVDPTASTAVLHHHQRFDGLGFPEREDEYYEMRGLAGEAIHIFPRIIAAADLYDWIRHQGSDSPVRTRVRTLRLVQQYAHARKLDPEVLRALCDVTPPYPIGSVVTLNTGDKAVVTAWSAKAPCRPEVRIVKGLESDDAEMSTGETIDLNESTDLAIAFAEGSHVLYDNYDIGMSEESTAA